jgi:hypothetical protein
MSTHTRERDAYEQCVYKCVHTCTLYTWAWTHTHMNTDFVIEAYIMHE